MSEKGVIALLPLVLVIAAVAIVLYILVSQGIIKNPLPGNLPGIKQDPTVSLQTTYDNPFDQSSQYVNPFASYKNPFDSLTKAK